MDLIWSYTELGPKNPFAAQALSSGLTQVPLWTPKLVPLLSHHRPQLISLLSDSPGDTPERKASALFQV